MDDRIYSKPEVLLGDLRGGLCSSGLCKQLRSVAADEIERLDSDAANERTERESWQAIAKTRADEGKQLRRERDQWEERHNRERAAHAKNLTEQQKCEAERDRLRAALEQIRDYHVIQGMSPALFAEKVLGSSDSAGENP